MHPALHRIPGVVEAQRGLASCTSILHMYRCSWLEGDPVAVVVAAAPLCSTFAVGECCAAAEGCAQHPDCEVAGVGRGSLLPRRPSR